MGGVAATNAVLHNGAVAELGEPPKPNHISKKVPSTVHLGPPNRTKSRTFHIRFAVAV